MLTKRLVCGAAAYVAVRVKGRAVVELAKDAVLLGRRWKGEQTHRRRFLRMDDCTGSGYGFSFPYQLIAVEEWLPAVEDIQTGDWSTTCVLI